MENLNIGSFGDTVACIIRFMNPYKTLPYFYRYWKTITVIDAKQRNRRMTFEEEKLYRVVTSRFRIANVITAVKMSHLLYLWFHPTNDLFYALLNIDPITVIMKMKPISQLGIIGYFVLIIFFMRDKFFYRLDPIVITMITDVLVHRNLQPYFRHPFVHQGKPILSCVERILVKTMNLMQFPLLVMYVCGAFLHYYSWKVILVLNPWTEDLPFVLATLLAFLCFELSILFYGIVAFYVEFVAAILITVITILFKFGFIIFHQNNVQFAQMTLISLFTLPFKLRFSRKSIIILMKMSLFFSEILYVYMFASIPMSSYMLGQILVVNLSHEWIAVLFFPIIFMWLGIFGIHYVAARMNRAVTKPNKRLLSTIARRHHLTLRSRLTLSLYIQDFHTRKKYGIGYGKYGGGTISMFSFLKTMLFYSEIILYGCTVAKSFAK